MRHEGARLLFYLAALVAMLAGISVASLASAGIPAATVSSLDVLWQVQAASVCGIRRLDSEQLPASERGLDLRRDTPGRLKGDLNVYVGSGNAGHFGEHLPGAGFQGDGSQW